MDIQQKFDTLRAAAVEVVGVSDLGDLIGLLGQLTAEARTLTDPFEKDTAAVSVKLIVALIETHPDRRT